mmetsp:Transcript_18896/g.56307  ORF Transcript_18896/g.56307 Transcript_18896/m.56307 type:complete len:219 (-) Transcript_18896:433-1089(-)
MGLRTCGGTSPQLPTHTASLSPMMPLSGVRSSWLMLLMKRSFCSTRSFSSWITWMRLPSSTMRIAMRRRCSIVRKLPYMSEQLNMTLPAKSATVHVHSSTATLIGIILDDQNATGKRNHSPSVTPRRILRFWRACGDCVSTIDGSNIIHISDITYTNRNMAITYIGIATYSDGELSARIFSEIIAASAIIASRTLFHSKSDIMDKRYTMCGVVSSHMY